MLHHTFQRLTLATVCAIALPTVWAGTVENFGENIAPLQHAFQQKKVHIVQFGDSHTAGDYFTEQLRKRLQEDIGMGGIGFVYPAKINGQRNARHDYRASQGWHVSNSRFQQQGDYALGGITATATQDAATFTLTSQNYSGLTQDARVLLKGEKGQTLSIQDSNGTRQVQLNRSGWQTLPTSINLPATLTAPKQLSLAGIWLDATQGGTVSAIGINGATQDYWQRWRQNVAQDLSDSKADLVILAYGTNEAFQSQLDQYQINVQQTISKIRQGLPNASILIVNAPESLKNTDGECGTRANNLDLVQSQLRRIAQQNKTLYWEWQTAMGGECSMKSWINKGLAVKDGVHFTRAGYEQAADDLYQNLKLTLNRATTLNVENNTAPPTLHSDVNTSTSTSNPENNPPASSPATPKLSSQGSGKICDSDGHCVHF